MYVVLPQPERHHSTVPLALCEYFTEMNVITQPIHCTEPQQILLNVQSEKGQI